MSTEPMSVNAESSTPGDSLLVLFQLFWNKRIVLLISCALGIALGVGLSYLKTPQYTAEAVVVYVSDKGSAEGLGAIAGELGGLAALAGVNMGGLSKGKDEVVAFLDSAELGRRFLEDQKIGERIWTSSETLSRLLHIESKYDWRKAFKELQQIRTIIQDKKTGAIRIIFEWREKELVAEWANSFVKFADEQLRRDALAETDQRLGYLRDRLANENQVEIRSAMGRLIENELRMAMMANARTNFSLKILDPAVEPLTRSSPSRAKYALLGFLASLAMVSVYVLVSARSDR